MIGGDAVAEQRERASAGDGADGVRLFAQLGEIGRQANVGGLRLELKQFAFVNVERPPGVIAAINIRINGAEGPGIQRLFDDVGDPVR